MTDAYTEVLDRTIGAGIGRILAAVVYRTYEESTPRSAVLAGAGWFLGEAAVRFAGSSELFLTWTEEAYAEDNFALLPSLTTTYEDTVVDISALDAPEWLPVRDHPLLKAEVLGVNSNPHVLVLQFANGAGVCIGVGNGDELGDGDQMLVRPLPEPQLSRFPQVLWRRG